MFEPDVETGRQSCGQHVVSVGEHHLVTDGLVVVEPVRVEIIDPYPVLFLGPVPQKLLYPLDPLDGPIKDASTVSAACP